MSRTGPDERDDRELVRAAQAGEREAVERLLSVHYDRVATLCRRLMSDPTDAEDATQVALIAVVSGLPRFDGRSAFTTWLHRVTTNACLDELRRRARRPTPTADDHLLAFEPVAEERDSAARLDIDAALAMLPIEFRVPVVLRDLCGLDYAEIGDVIGIPPGTVRSRIARGRRALADVFGNPRPSGVVQGDGAP